MLYQPGIGITITTIDGEDLKEAGGEEGEDMEVQDSTKIFGARSTSCLLPRPRRKMHGRRCLPPKPRIRVNPKTPLDDELVMHEAS
jgi:hypothetical protein